MGPVYDFTQAAALLLSGERLHLARRATGGRHVALQRVVHDHAISIEAPAQGADSAFHSPDPTARQPVLIALIVERNQLFVEHPIEVLAVALVMNLHVGVRPALADCEAIQAVESLGPPAIEYRKIQATVQNHLLPARARGLKGPCGIVQPYLPP